MDQQRRCLNGMTNGIPVEVPIAPAAPIVIHTLPADQNTGLAFLDVISLVLQNTDDTDNARVNIAFTPPGGVAVTQTYLVLPMTSINVLDEDPFGGPQSGLGGATISLQVDAAGSNAVRAWGWFVRSRG